MKKFLLALLVLSSSLLFSQEKTWDHFIGTNLTQITTTTVDLSYQISNKAWYDLVLNTGYTIDYSDSFDIFGFFLTPHYKCGNGGYSIQEKSGFYIKTGARFNLRKEKTKNSYFFAGLFMTNSFVYEKGTYTPVDEPANTETVDLEHHIHIMGLTAWLGFNFKIAKRIYSDIGMQLSYPNQTYNELYGCNKYIPGMGYMETCGGERLFPLVVLNLKYKLN